MSSKRIIILFLVVTCIIDNTCANEELTCAGAFKNFFIFKDCTQIGCVKHQVSVISEDDILLAPSVIQRYIQYIKIGKQHKLTNLLFWSDWCIKIKNQCMEIIRMLGFKIEVYAIKKCKDKNKKANLLKLILENKKHSESLCILENDESVKNYVQNLNSKNPKDVETYCVEECTAKASNYNFTDESFSFMSRALSFGKTNMDNVKKNLPQNPGGLLRGLSSLKKSKATEEDKKDSTSDEDKKDSTSIEDNGKTEPSTNAIDLDFKDEINEENKKRGFDRCLPRLQVVTKSLPQLNLLKQYYKNMSDFCRKECI